MNKKGQGMSTSTIVLLILGMVVLVVLIIGFSSGWNSFNKIMNPTNVDSVVDDCSSACSLSQVFSYCSESRTYRINEEKLNIKTSCAVLSNAPSFGGYISDCGNIQCDLTCSQIIIEDKKGTQKKGILGATLPQGAYDVTSLAKDANGQVCYIQ